MARSREGTTPAGTWGDWLAPAEAWARVLSVWNPAPLPGETVPLSEAHGRVLAADVAAPADSPAFDRSAMDGYAVRAADVAAAADGAPARLTYAGDVPMGAASAVTVAPGQAVWVATGSMIPDGADGVVMVERTERDGAVVAVSQAVAPGNNVIRRGSDLRAGDVVLAAGRRLRPHDIAALASMGVASVPVRRKPRVAIVSGGDELVTPGEPLAPGQIYDSNSYAMAAQIAAWGGEPVILPRVHDDPAEVRAALAGALARAEVVLLSGGSSVGIKDLTADAIDAAGQPGVLLHGVAMRPGRPTIVGVVGGVLVIGIPGNPVSAMVSCEVFARPALDALLGVQPSRPAGQVGASTKTGTLTERVRSQAGRQDYVRVRLDRSAEGVAVSPVPGGSSAIRSMVDADGLLVVPPECEALEPGEMVTVNLF